MTKKGLSISAYPNNIVKEIVEHADNPETLSCADADGNLTSQVIAGINPLWSSKTVKGYLGEILIRDLLHRNRLAVYVQEPKLPHAFDMLAIKDKKETLITECKCKPRRHYYDDTGIDIEQYIIYCEMSEKINSELLLVFIDESLGEVYGNLLSELSKPHVDASGVKYPLRQNNIIYFSLESMQRHLAHLDAGTIKALKKLSNNYYTSGGISI